MCIRDSCVGRPTGPPSGWTTPWRHRSDEHPTAADPCRADRPPGADRPAGGGADPRGRPVRLRPGGGPGRRPVRRDQDRTAERQRRAADARAQPAPRRDRAAAAGGCTAWRAVLTDIARTHVEVDVMLAEMLPGDTWHDCHPVMTPDAKLTGSEAVGAG